MNLSLLINIKCRERKSLEAVQITVVKLSNIINHILQVEFKCKTCLNLKRFEIRRFNPGDRDLTNSLLYSLGCNKHTTNVLLTAPCVNFVKTEKRKFTINSKPDGSRTTYLKPGIIFTIYNLLLSVSNNWFSVFLTTDYTAYMLTLYQWIDEDALKSNTNTLVYAQKKEKHICQLVVCVFDNRSYCIHAHTISMD